MNYFDHAASSIIFPEVLDVLAISLRDDFANPSAKHLIGHELQEKIENFRDDFKKVLSAKSSDLLIFTSSATESNNTVIRGLNLQEGDVVLYSKADHPSVTAPLEYLLVNTKIELREIVLDKNGQIETEIFSALIDEKVKLVVLTHVNNQSGVILNLDLLSRLVKDKSSAHLHIDAVQSFGKLPFKLNPFIDSLSLSSHKIGGPKGIAGLFLKSTHKVQPLLFGGDHENGMRASTLAYPLIAAFHKAMNISLRNAESDFLRILKLKERIIGRLESGIASIEFPFKLTSPYIISFVLPGISSDIILRHLETKKIFISSSSACSSKISGFNSTLEAMNIPERFHKNFLRISLGKNTNEDEVELLITEFLNIWNSLKHMRER